MMGMPATNQSVKSDGVDIVVFKDGKAVEHWGVQDNLAIMKQLGMMPPMGIESPKKKNK
jgi:predicted ester cyclase